MAFRILTLALLLITLHTAPALADSDAPSLHEADTRAGVILSYHHINNEHDNALSQEQFTGHMNLLGSGDYALQPLPALSKSLRNNQKTSPHSIALTFDVMNIAIFESLIQRSSPFTIFIAPDKLTKTQRKWVSKQRDNALITFGLTTTFSSPHDIETSRRTLHKAITEFRGITAQQPHYFSYQAGLYTRQIQELITSNGFKAAFGQQSGVAYNGSDMMTLPRFTMTAQHGGMERFEMIINALPLPTAALAPTASITRTATPAIGMTLPEELENKADINCFVNGQEKPRLIFPSPKRLEIRLTDALQPHRRTRINCITKADKDEKTGQMRWRWGGFLLQYSPQ